MWISMFASTVLAISPPQARAALDDAYIPFTAQSLLQRVADKDLTTVGLFLDAGMSPDTHVPGVGSALGVAARAAGVDMLELLLQRGAQANDAGQPGALCLAAARVLPDQVERLLAAGADPSRACGEGEPTPLLVALDEGYAENARRLLAAGAVATGKTRYGGKNSLHLAAFRSKQNDLIPLLIAAGAAVDARDDSKDTPLCKAAHHGGLLGIRHLLDGGAQPDLACSGDRTTALILAIEHDDSKFGAPQRAEAVAALLAAGARPEGGVKVNSDPPPLAAIARDDADVMGLLLKAGLDPNWRDARGRPLQQIAGERGAAKIAALLSSKGVSP